MKYYIMTSISPTISNRVRGRARRLSRKLCGTLWTPITAGSGKNWGGEVNPDRLRLNLLAAGVKRVELRSPGFAALRDGKDGAVPQVAKLGAVSIVSGGYEDE